MTFYSCGMDIEYMVSGPEGLDIIQPLWEGLREHHAVKAPAFADSLRQKPFETRKKELLEKAPNGKLKIFLATDAIEGILAGYCIASVTGDGEGEIDSIFIEENYRGREIGERLMQSAVDWLETQASERILVQVLAGNEEVFEFYRRFGFQPRTHMLQQVRTDEPDGHP